MPAAHFNEPHELSAFSLNSLAPLSARSSFLAQEEIVKLS